MTFLDLHHLLNAHVQLANKKGFKTKKIIPVELYELQEWLQAQHS
jgi:hypothetical protein